MARKDGLAGFRNLLYGLARLLGDFQAARNGRAGRRSNRVRMIFSPASATSSRARLRANGFVYLSRPMTRTSGTR